MAIWAEVLKLVILVAVKELLMLVSLTILLVGVEMPLLKVEILELVVVILPLVEEIPVEEEKELEVPRVVEVVVELYMDILVQVEMIWVEMLEPMIWEMTLGLLEMAMTSKSKI